MASKQENRSTEVTLLYTTGLHQELIKFQDVAEKDKWIQDTTAIKEGSSVAYHTKEKEGETAKARVLYKNWIATVRSFKETYGEDRTPQDIKYALNSVEKAVGVDVTKWRNPPKESLFE